MNQPEVAILVPLAGGRSVTQLRLPNRHDSPRPSRNDLPRLLSRSRRYRE